MEIINITGIDEKLYYEKLPNGLEVYLFPMLRRHRSAVKFMTKFGGKDVEFVPYDGTEMIKVREGVAHFLEHRLCTDKHGRDLFDFYAKSGAWFNATTSSYTTSYHFDCTINLIDNLIYLLDSIQDADFKEEDIEKEKGIIEQEIKRKKNNSYTLLYEESVNNTFWNYPIRNKTLGNIDDIMNINKEMLTLCYKTFYQPHNMALIVTGNFDVDGLITEIRKNQSSKTFLPKKEIILKEYEEPNTVPREYSEIIHSVDVPKLRMKIKVPLHELKKLPNYDLYIGITFMVNFGSTSLFVERMKQKGYMGYNLGMNFGEQAGYVIITINYEGDSFKEIESEIKKVLTNLTVNEEELERYKKVYISNEVIAFEGVTGARDYFEYMLTEYGKIINDEMGRTKTLNLSELKDVVDCLNLSNISTTILRPNKEV